eukprot:scaffold63195_cov37-Phaeocystis_antarctica.AAC.2
MLKSDTRRASGSRNRTTAVKGRPWKRASSDGWKPMCPVTTCLGLGLGLGQHPIGAEAVGALPREARVLAPLDEVHVAVEDAAEVARRAPQPGEFEEQRVAEGGAAALGDVREEQRMVPLGRREALQRRHVRRVLVGPPSKWSHSSEGSR